jgi:hypothetical protein
MSLRTAGRRLFRSIIGETFASSPNTKTTRPTRQVFELQPLERRLFLTAYPSISPDSANSSSVVWHDSSYVLDLNPNTDDDPSQGHWQIDFGDGNVDNWVSGNSPTDSHTYGAGPNGASIDYSITAAYVDGGNNSYPSNSQNVHVIGATPSPLNVAPHIVADPTATEWNRQ